MKKVLLIDKKGRASFLFVKGHLLPTEDDVTKFLENKGYKLRMSPAKAVEDHHLEVEYLVCIPDGMEEPDGDMCPASELDGMDFFAFVE